MRRFNSDHKSFDGAVVMAQLVEQLRLTPEVCSLNPVIGKIYVEHCLLPTVLKRRNKVKEAGNGPFY